MKVSLNLAETYVPNWGIWEVAREVICNARDAGDHTIKIISSDEIEVWSSKEQSISELMVIGATSKANNPETIGQFGEGFKLAALVATRLAGRFVAQTSSHSITFFLKRTKGIAARVLHADIHEATQDATTGLLVKITLPGIAAIIDGKFIDRNLVKVEKTGKKMRLFSKGVFIQERDEESVWDWNLNLKLNRDRNQAENWELAYEISRYFRTSGTQEDFEKILTHPECFEIKNLNLYYSSTRKDEMIAAFHAVFGQKAVLPSTRGYTNQLAIIKGFEIVNCPGNLERWGVPTADDVIPKMGGFKEVTVPAKFLAEAAEVLDILEVPAIIKFFEDFHEAPEGEAVVDNGNIVCWLNEHLLMPGRRSLRLSTIAHELAHIKSKAGDTSINFEYSLTMFCGKLLEKLIERR